MQSDVIDSSIEQRISSARSSTRMPIWLWVVPGLVAAASYLDLAIRSSSLAGASWVDWARCLVVVSFAIGFVAVVCNRTRRTPSRKGILAFSLLFHLIGIVGSPVLEDDGNRYLFDGWVFAQRGSPYGIPPSAFFDSLALPPEIESSLSGINNPDLPTIYGPTTEWVFRLAHAISPGRIVVLQVIMACLGFALVCLVSRWAKPLPLLFLAWHPLLIKESAFTAHFDVLAVLLMVIALSVPRRFGVAVGATLALAVGAKLFAILIVPVVLHSRTRAWLAFGATLLALYAPFFDSILPTMTGVAEDPLWAMGTAWIFNAPLYELLQPLTGRWALRVVLAAVLIGYWALWTRASWRLPDGEWPRGDRLFGVMLICSPVLNPWYVLWPLVFWLRHPTAWLAVGSLTVLLSYASGLNLGDRGLAPYEISAAVLTVEFTAIAVALAVDVGRRQV